jgi:hypothetical protein
MDKLTKRQLQKALNDLTEANNKAVGARDKIMAHSQAVYGCEPGDVDNDAYIDACDAGMGLCEGMTVEEFEQSMEECMGR